MVAKSTSSAGRPAAPGVLDGTVGFHLARASVVAYAAFEEHIGAAYGLRKVDFSLLMLLDAHGSLPPKQLVRWLSLSAPKLSMVLERMEAQGWIHRSPDAHDRRSVQVALSAEGLRLVRGLTPVARRMEQGLKKRLGAADHATLIQLLRKLADGTRPADGA
ncbi:MAG: MarR family winged helix-turn-helix transcriptional regulator [Burkholderiaceae bacterium]